MTKVKGVRVEKSQRNPQERPWWWLLGDTFPHRHILKEQGARFSSKRHAWYYIGWELPEAIQQLLTEDARNKTGSTVPDVALCTDETAERILGVRLAPLSPTLLPDNRGEFLPPQAAEVVNPQNFHPVDETIIDAASNSQAAPLDTDLAIAPAVPDAAQHIRVFKPLPQPTGDEPLDRVQSAIKQAKTGLMPISSIVSATERSSRTAAIVKQAYVGELTGSITGHVYCYGYAVH